VFNYLYITNIPEIAAYVESFGVSRIFLDLEIIGKEVRQGHLNTVISRHSISDVAKVKSVLNDSKLLVRINPYYENTCIEIDEVIKSGADIIMLPMIQSVDEVIKVGRYINGRAVFIPLIETIYSAENITEIHDLKEVDELHIGLNDLHLEMNKEFMFQLISEGYVDNMVKSLSKPFGIGGVARVGQGAVSADLVLAEHVRLGSSSVILSRAFHLCSTTLNDLIDNLNFPKEFKKLESMYLQLNDESMDVINSMHEDFINKVTEIVGGA
jgi:2-keto-3-deoxy-L-rhamnonate aldolase RhmA